MSGQLTDRMAVRVALLVAIDTEESLIDAYRSSHTKKVDESEEGVKISRRRIKAFHRVLDRYFGGAGESEMEKALKGSKLVSIFDLMKGEVPE